MWCKRGVFGGAVFLVMTWGAEARTRVPQTFRGTARTRDGVVAYVERHEIIFDKAKRIRACTTVYERESGEVMATLHSDFSRSLATPDHVAENRLTGDRYGLRREGESLIMFKQDKDKSEKTRGLAGDFSGESLAVAGQGINYYVQANVDKIRAEKTTALTLLIPGRLNYFTFKMEAVSELNDILYLEFTASNFFIRLFVPKLKVQFDVKHRRLLRYEGVSNIADIDGKIREVIIDYEYPH